MSAGRNPAEREFIAQHYGFTPAEWRLIHLLPGHNHAELSNLLGISRMTIKNQMHCIIAKLGLKASEDHYHLRSKVVIELFRRNILTIDEAYADVEAALYTTGCRAGWPEHRKPLRRIAV
jgi:DNA-binding CsgD family transcriptional regulator